MSEQSSPKRTSEAAEQSDPEAIPPIDFNTFVLSLMTSALEQLGEDSSAPPTEAALGMARHTIDLLAMLETKTRGNLSGEEERLLSQVLTDLRMRYVSACKG